MLIGNPAMWFFMFQSAHERGLRIVPTAIGDACGGGQSAFATIGSDDQLCRHRGLLPFQDEAAGCLSGVMFNNFGFIKIDDPVPLFEMFLQEWS